VLDRKEMRREGTQRNREGRKEKWRSREEERKNAVNTWEKIERKETRQKT